jgi:molecular chaperone DnaK
MPASHSVKKSMTEHGDKLEGEEKAKIEQAIKHLEAIIMTTSV